MAGVVDVFAGAGEVQEAGGRRQLGIDGDPLGEPVLDRLDVVVGGALDRLDRFGVGVGEGGDELAQEGERFR